MSQAEQTLKWGDIIRIHGVSINPDPVKQTKGLIISKGFTDPNVYYQTYALYSDVNFYRESLFQILPKSNFDLHDQLQSDENLQPQQYDALKERAKQQINQLKTTLESKVNDKEHPDLIFVTYGSQVVFKHIQSGQYLSGVLKAADIGEGAFKLQLAKDLSSFLIFKIISHRSYENEGNKIYYNDCLKIHHTKSDCYMNFPDTETSIIFDSPYDVAKFFQGDEGYEYANSRPSIKKPKSRRINVINENKSKCLWKFIQHCRYDESLKKDKIKSHDIVYFQHTKNKGLIASTLAQNQYYLKQLRNSDEQTVSYQCFWELIPQEGNQNGPQRCNSFIARNIVTGQILTFEGFEVQILSKQQIQNGGFKSQGLVNLVCAKSQEGKNKLLERGLRIQPDDNANEVVKYFDSNINKIDFKAVEQLSQDSFIIVRVSEQTIGDVAYILSSQQAFVKVVQILTTELKKKKGDPSIDWKTFFLSLNQDLLVSFISVLKLLTAKIYKTQYQNIESSGNSPIVQVQKILVQTGIAQLLIEIIHTLYEPFQQIIGNNEINQDRAIRLRVSQIFGLSYVLVQKIVKDCLENKIYFSRWVELFLKHSNNINRSFIQQTLVNILQNNPVSIKAMIKPEIIDKLINYFFEDANQHKQRKNDDQYKDVQLTTKHLRLFSTFIKGDDVIFKQNQKIILDSFFNTDKNQYGFKFKVEYRISDLDQNIDDGRQKERNKVVKVIFGKGDPYTIPEFIRNQPTIFNYFLSYINLLADVCMDRNNQAIEYVETYVPLAAVSTILFDPQISSLGKQISASKIHEPFIRIGHHAYVNNFKFSPIRRIRKIVKWYKFEDDKQITDVEDITKTKRVYEGQKQEQQKNYLKYLLIYIKTFLKNCTKQINDLQILHTVLNFLKETILLGLWESIDQFRQIIPLLIKNITKIDSNIFFDGYTQTVANRYSAQKWVNLNKQKLRMNRPEIALIIQCKIKATQIFKYINQMEIDIRLRYLMNFFHGIYDATENFENYSQSIQDQVNESAINEQDKDAVITRNNIAKDQFYKIFGTNILGEVTKISQDQDMMLRENIWYNKIRTMIPLQYEPTEEHDKDRDLFKLSNDYPLSSIVLSLFQLTGYLNKNLLNSSLNMLRAMFEQRNDIIDSFKNLLIDGKGNLNQVYINLKFMRNKFAMLKNDTILNFDGNANKSFPYAIFKPYDHLGRQQDKRSGIIQDLFFLARTLKDGVSLKNIESLMYVQKQVFDKQAVYHFYSQKQKNNALFQELNMAEGIYDPLIQYIKIVGNQQLKNQIHRWLLFSIYQYLTLLCFNNMKAKHLFMSYIPYIMPHLNKRVGAASFLYEVCINNKILVNSQQIVNSIIEGALNSCIDIQQRQIIQVIYESIVNPISQDITSNSNYQKSRILYSLRGVLIFNDEGHKKNQQILMNKLQDSKYRRLVFQGELPYTAKKEQFNLSPPQAYATTHFQLFSSLVQSQNLINIGKLENLHPYTYCLNRLTQTNRWQIRRALRSYINRLYYVHKDRDIFLFEQFIRKEFKIINKELQDLIELHRSKMLTQDLKVKNGIRFVYAQSEIILLIIEILITLHEIFLKPLFIRLLQRQLKKQFKFQEEKQKILHHQLIKLLKNLGCINKLYHNTKTVVSFIRQIKKLMQAVLLTFHVRFLENKTLPQADTQPIVQQQNVQVTEKQPQVSKNTYQYDNSRSFFRNLVEMMKFLKQHETKEQLKKDFVNRKALMEVSENDMKKKYIDVIFAVPGENLKPLNSVKIKQQEQFHYKPHLQTANSKIFKVLAKPELQENEQNLQLNNRLNSVKQLLSDSPAFKKLKQDQFYKLVRLFTKIDQNGAQCYTSEWEKLKQEPKPVFSKKQIITNCFSLIINYPEKITDSQKIFIIKLVRCYITEAVEQQQNHKLPVDKWSPDYYTDEKNGSPFYAQDKSQLVKRQHEIQQCGGSKLLLSILKQNLYQKTQLLNQTLLLGIAYLFNGNTYCQNSILAELKADPANSTLFNLRLLIKNIGSFLIQVRKFKQNQKKRVFSYKIVDSYDHFDRKQNIIVKMFGHKTDKFEIQTELNYELALCRTFRFLQLFCQNNNIDMKKFLLKQTNQDETPKEASVNFIEEACQLLRQFFKIMSSKVVSIPPSLLDFINQITQIPCLSCQKSLMSSTFFEDISYMAGFFESKENIQQRKFSFFIETSPKQGQPVIQDDPLLTLMEIYQKGVGLALSNFQGNQFEVYQQFLNKCQARFLWIVIRQNLIKLLRPKSNSFGVNRQIIEAQIEKQYNEAAQNKDQNRLIYQQYRQFLVQHAFIRRIFSNFNKLQISKLIEEERAHGKEYCPSICSILNVLSLIKKIDDYAILKQKVALANPQSIDPNESAKAFKAKNFRKQLWEVAKEDSYTHITDLTSIFEELLLSIQVSSHNGKVQGVQNIYFPNHPVFSYLASDTRDTIMFQVGRQNRRDKVNTLFEHYDELKEQIQWSYDLKYGEIELGSLKMPFSITSGSIDKVRTIARYISYGICALMLYLIIVDHDKLQQASYFTFFYSNQRLFMRVVCLVQLALTLLFLGLWIKMRLKLCKSKLVKMQQDQAQQQASGGGQQEEQTIQDSQEAPPPVTPFQKVFSSAIKISNLFYKFFAKITGLLNSFQSIYNFIKEKPGFSHLGRFLSFVLTPIFQIIKQFFLSLYALNNFEAGFLSIVIFVFASVMGNFVGVEWFVIHLFDYFVGISLLTNVFKAVINNIRQLSLLSLFAGCFIIVFNVVSLDTYTPVIYQDDLPTEACEQVLGCVLSVYTSGAIGDDMDQIYPDRFIADTIYVIFMEILFSNLVSGIMIDGFSELKETDQARDQDKKSKCYICALQKSQMQKQGETFKKHCDKHFLWNYMFYRYIIKMKDPSEFTGLQYSICTQMDQQKVDWFPDNGPKEQSGQIENLIGSIKQKMSLVNQNISKLVEKTGEEVSIYSKAVEKAIDIKKNNQVPAV